VPHRIKERGEMGKKDIEMWEMSVRMERNQSEVERVRGEREGECVHEST
jgi:hypothetical protein